MHRTGQERRGAGQMGRAGQGKARKRSRSWRGVWACVLLALAACGTSQQEDPGSGYEDGSQPPGGDEPKPDPGAPPPEACHPVSCADRGASCGTLPDGCGGTLDCGGCQSGHVCGLRQPNVCGDPACKPRACADVHAQCGAVDDGCGGTLQCGTCAVGETCGGGGQANMCGAPDYGAWPACSRDGVCFLSPSPTSNDLKDVWGRSMNDFWAVGEAGFIVHGGKSGLSVLPSDAELSGIWGSAAEDVWAVGSRILHFDGRRWSEALKPTHSLLDVYGTHAGNVWAVGEAGVAYVWNGRRWELQDAGTTVDLFGVWASGDTVWAVGARSTIRVRESGFWHALPPPALDVTLTGVWGSGPKDVWVTGSRSGAVLFHWNGGSWTSVQLPFSALYGISGSSARDILVVGEEGAAHYDGSVWTPVLGGSSATRLLGAWQTADGTLVVGAAGRIQRAPQGQGWSSLDRGPRSDFVALSAPEGSDRWWFADGNTVRQGLEGSGYVAQGPANAFAEQGLGSLWVAGNSGRVDRYTWDSHGSGVNSFHLPESFTFRGVLPIRDQQAWLVGTDTATGEEVVIQFDGSGPWYRYALTAQGSLNAIHGTASNDVWAVGDSAIAHWDGASWLERREPTWPSFRAVRAISGDYVLALGPDTVWRWNGSEWRPLPRPPGLGNSQLRALFADSRDGFYVAGDAGLLFHFDRYSTWQRIETGTRKSLRAISGGPKTLIIAGDDGTVLRLYR